MNIFVKTCKTIKKVEGFSIVPIKETFCIIDDKGNILIECLKLELCQKVIDKIWNRLERYIDHDYGDLCVDLNRIVEEINDEERGELAF